MLRVNAVREKRRHSRIIVVQSQSYLPPPTLSLPPSPSPLHTHTHTHTNDVPFPLAFYQRLYLSIHPLSLRPDCSYAPQCDDSLSSCETLLDEGTEGAEDAVAIRVYRRRFWILLVFSAVSFCQYCAWNTFGPIAMTSKLVFDWSNTEIAILASMDPITYLFTMLLFSWLMDAKGIYCQSLGCRLKTEQGDETLPELKKLRRSSTKPPSETTIYE